MHILHKTPRRVFERNIQPSSKNCKCVSQSLRLVELLVQIMAVEGCINNPYFLRICIIAITIMGSWVFMLTGCQSASIKETIICSQSLQIASRPKAQGHSVYRSWRCCLPVLQSNGISKKLHDSQFTYLTRNHNMNNSSMNNTMS